MALDFKTLHDLLDKHYKPVVNAMFLTPLSEYDVFKGLVEQLKKEEAEKLSRMSKIERMTYKTKKYIKWKTKRYVSVFNKYTGLRWLGMKIYWYLHKYYGE